MRFQDRVDAGRLLAERLTHYSDRPDTVVVALPRGGVPVGFEVARRLNLPLDVLIVRKLGVPWQQELAMGAIASGGVRLLNDRVIQALGIGEEAIDAASHREQRELQRRESLYRSKRPPLQVGRRTVILVDDGVATGSTMGAAILALRKLNCGRIIVAVPTIAAETYQAMRKQADEFIALITPEYFEGVGQWYRDFSQTTDEEVARLLKQAEVTV